MNAENLNPAVALPAVPGTNAPDTNDDEIHLGELIATLLEHKWLIALITAFTLLLGGGYLYVAPPIYRADALLQIEDSKSSGLTALKELQPLIGESVSVAAQMEILKSRMILGRVVEQLKLDIVARPKYFPLLGAALARRYEGNQPAAPLLGLDDYAWGGERIQVESLEVPRAMVDEQLILVAAGDGRYTLYDANDAKVLEGRLNQVAVADGYRLFVSELVARPGTRFTLIKLDTSAAIEDLRDRFSVRERSKQSGVVEATLDGVDVALLPRILDAILNAYIRQNVEYRSAEAANTLKFLETQLPQVKSQVEAAEAALNQYRQMHGSVDLSLETKGVLDTIVELDKEIVQLQQKREEFAQRYTSEHPTMQALDAQMARLRAKRSQLDGQVTRLPATQQTILKLQRDFEVANKLYTDLLNTAQQLRVSKAGTVGDARIIDAAVVSSIPVAPKTLLILALSLLLGVLASLMVIWILRALRVAVEDPDKVEQALNLPVYATVPHSDNEEKLAREIKRGRRQPDLLALAHPDDNAVESLRSLRTTIHFALLDAAKGSLLITGPAPGIGKSFVSKNLAAVLAQAGKRVVVIDADLRKGHIHREFGLPREQGVSEFISGTATLADIIKPTSLDGLSVITTGQRPPNPSELLMHPHFAELLDQLADLFDILIVDAPPVLAVSDAAIIGRHTGAALVILRAGRHPMGEIQQTVKRLTQAGVPVKGFIFNDMNLMRQKYRYGYHGYVYQYSYK